MPLVTEKLTYATLRFQTSEKIRTGILRGSLKPGERLVERDLAEQVGTSLTVVREALVQLETEGFITKRPNSATHITQLSRVEIEQILVVRRVLEGFALEEAARKATAEQIRLLETLHQQAVEAARASKCQEYIHGDLLWHDAVWQATGNEALRGALKRLVLPLFGFSAIQVASREGFDLRQDAYSHLPLLEAIRKRDPAAARQAFETAFDAWRGRLVETDTAASDKLRDRRDGKRRLPSSQRGRASRARGHSAGSVPTRLGLD
jgi:DNA-binding GntR family transcriptional regulator